MTKQFLTLVLTLIITIPAMAETYKTSDGIILDYEIKGSGETLVLLHSGMMSRDDMRMQIEYFSNTYQVIAIDSREQGRSSESPKQITYDLMSNDVIELLDHLNIKQTNIFGQSDGGITALLTAHYHPTRIKKLIIHGAVYNYTGYSPETIAAMKQYSWDANNPEDIDPTRFPGMAIKSYLLGRKDLTDFQKHLHEMASMWSSSPNLTAKDLNKISIPTLIIVGDHWDVSLRHSIEMHEELSNSELFVAPGATHYIHKEKPDLLHKVISDFLNQ